MSNQNMVIMMKVIKFYLHFPSSKEEWLRIAKQFETNPNFPNCLGTVDGMHFAIRPPSEDTFCYYNYRGLHSHVQMGLAKASCVDTYECISFGTNRSISAGESNISV
jgi:hypothetical protein